MTQSLLLLFLLNRDVTAKFVKTVGWFVGTQTMEKVIPIKDGTWSYYTANGTLIKKEFWNKGVLLKVKNY